MQWTDEGIVLASRPYGEGGAVASAFTRGHGRHAGLVRGARGKARRGLVQPGNRLALTWIGRLEEQLGYYGCELIRAHAAEVLDDAGRLAALTACCALAELALPEHDPQPEFYDATVVLLDALAGEVWPAVYVHWELALLRAAGYGLDLSACAVTGAREDLAWVSPRTGRAVSEAAAGPWRDRLLALPGFLAGGGEPDRAGIRAGLGLTGHFLERSLLVPAGKSLPPARSRLVDRF